MYRYLQSAFIAATLVGLVALAAGCGVRETTDRPGAEASSTVAVASQTAVNPSITSDGPTSLPMARAGSVSYGQTLSAIRSAIETEEYNARMKGQVPPTWNAETSTAVSKVFDVERTRIAQAPSTTPYILNTTPFVGPGKLIEHPQAPFPAIDFIGMNSWNYTIGEKSITVYAGRQGRGAEHDQDFNQGMVKVVDWTTHVPKTVSSNKMPVSDGPARIVDAQVEGEQLYLTIVTEGGSRYRFHVNSGEFTPLL